ncbi:MAG: 16S rRNA (guanine(527)-N(7))-methyltransferase RsmG [Gammaproteobacteria bacterium]|nr:MAG: 16S rRNA (guanine(527)-N(7))-methyltransferase RsmG [Gammaproteobacteria bacterium]
MGSHEKTVRDGIEQLNLSVSKHSQCLMLKYLELLQKWNKVFNLTAIRNIDKMIAYHLLDSLSIIPYITGKTVLDVGSGSGLPGIPLALVLANTQFTLVDSNGKKTRFLNQVVAELGLNNVQVLNCRIEQYNNNKGFDSIVCRAYTSLGAFIKDCESVANSSSDFLAMKGVIPDLEIKGLADDFDIKIIPLQVPRVEGQRHLIIANKK